MGHFDEQTPVAEVDKREIILKYLIELKPTIEKLSNRTTIQLKLEPMVSIKAFINRMVDTLEALNSFDNANDLQSIHNMNNEITLLQAVSSTLSDLEVYFATRKVPHVAIRQMKPVFTIAIPSIGACTKDQTAIFLNNFTRTFEQIK